MNIPWNAIATAAILAVLAAIPPLLNIHAAMIKHDPTATTPLTKLSPIISQMRWILGVLRRDADRFIIYTLLYIVGAYLLLADWPEEGPSFEVRVMAAISLIALALDILQRD